MANRAGKRAAIVLAVAVHLVLALILFYGVRWQTHAPEAVEVELVRAAPPAPPSAPLKEQVPPPPPPAPKPEPKPAPELKPPPKPDIALKDKEKPKPKETPKPAPEAKPKPDPFQEQLQRETALREQTRLADAIAKEEAQLKNAKAAAARSKAINEYLARIIDKIRGNVVLPPEVKGNPEAVFDVTQLPSGEIISVRVKRGSGNAALDSAVERAILKSSPLPKPEQADLFSRSLDLRYKPYKE